MEDLKKVQPKDDDEKKAIEFLLMDKTNWESTVEEKNYKIKCQVLKMKNPINDKEEEKLCFLTEATIDKDAKSVVDLLDDFGSRKKFDTLYDDTGDEDKKFKLLKKEDVGADHTRYELYLYLKMPFVFSDRDFCVRRDVWRNYGGVKDACLIHFISYNNPAYPEKSKPVRGIFYNRACYIKPLGDKCQFTLVNCIDMTMPDVGFKISKSKGTSGGQTFITGLMDALK